MAQAMSKTTHPVAKITLWLLFTLLVFALLVKLGLWQLSRAHEKEARLARINALSSQKAMTVAQLMRTPELQTENFTRANDIALALSGQFEQSQTFFLDNQIDSGRFGYRVLRVFNDNSGYKILVNLGWVEGDSSRQTLPQLTPITEKLNLSGNIQVPELTILLDDQSFSDIPNDPSLIRVQQLDIEKISRLSGQKLLPFALYLDKKETIGYKKNWQPMVMPAEKHRGYAFQWFSMAAVWLVLMVIFSRRQLGSNSRTRNNDQDIGHNNQQ